MIAVDLPTPAALTGTSKKGREAGTLEITGWAREGRLGCKVSAGRTGEWIAAALERRLAAR